jgi:hypothetical protein
LTEAAAQHREQLEWEARVGRPAGTAAIASALFALAAVIAQATAFQDAPDGDRGALITIEDNAGQLWAATALRDIGILLLGFALYYLFRVTRHRQPLPGIVGPLILLGPVLLVIASILGQADLASIAGDFTESGVTEGREGEERAENLLDDRTVAGPAVGAGGTLALALSLVFVNLNAMRGGVLSRFMGIIGIITGALLVLPLSPLPVVQVFWLGALGALFLGRWPGGRGPAWETGEPIPWPSAAQRREGTVGDAVRRQFEPPPEPEPDPEPEAETEPRPEHPVSKKRKRKRRR